MKKINKNLLIFIAIGVIIIGLVIYFFVIRNSKLSAQSNKMTKVLDEQILFPTLDQSGENLLYFSIDSKKELAFYKYSLTTKIEQKISENLDVPENVIWSPNRDKVILKVIYDQYVFEKFDSVFKDYSLQDKQEMTWSYDFKTKKLSRLDLNIQTINWLDNNRVVYQIYDPKNYTATIFAANTDGSNPEKIKDIDYTEAIGLGMLSNKEIYYFPILSESGGNNIYKLDLGAKQSSELIKNNTGGQAISTTNSNKILFQIFHEKNNNFAMGLMNKDGSDIQNLKINIANIVNKTAWSNDGQFFIVAVKEKETANDKFYKVEVNNGKITNIKYSSDKDQKLVTAENLTISLDNKTLYFTSDDLLYKLDLK